MDALSERVQAAMFADAPILQAAGCGRYPHPADLLPDPLAA
jgi:hypothetical protein